jgi:SNF2 family DNA or RNA helicase
MIGRITTYHEVLRNWIKPDEIIALKSKYGSDEAAYHRELTKKLGVLYHINWYRIILDEAHQIKNLAAQSECFSLRSITGND